MLFFAVDDLRTELGTYGHSMITSPNIDQLASRSMLFERAYCQVAVCSPSRASIMTGRRPDTNHVWTISNQDYWRTFTNATSIPQYFKEKGYISIGMGKLYHPGAPSGYDDVAYSWSPEGLPYYHSPVLGEFSNKSRSWTDFDGYLDNQLPDGQLADRAIKVLKQLKNNRTENGDNRPFFLGVGFHKPHLPFNCPGHYFDMYPPASEIKLPPNPYPPAGMPPIAWSGWGELRSYEDIHKLFVNNSKKCKDNNYLDVKDCHVPDDVVRELRRAYYSCVSYTDAQIGKVVKGLEEQGFADDTIIVMWADHGWQLGEHGEWCKHTNFEDAAHVPLILHVPGVTDAGMRTKAFVELIDVFPTLTELVGIETPPMCPKENHKLLTCVEGTSVVPLLRDPNKVWKKASFSQYPRESEKVMGYSIRVDNYRFTEWIGFDRTTAMPHWDNVVGVELYNHTEPIVFFNDENKNMAHDPSMASLVKELHDAVVAGWRDALPPQ